MQFKPHGPIGRVTGSTYELFHESRGYRFLVDCGQRQGPDSAGPNRARFPYDPRSIHAVFLTHAHLDHCGMLPRLYADGFSGVVYATNETRRLAEAVLVDAARLDSLHTVDDVKRIRWCEPNGLRSSEVRIEEDLTVRYFETGHILGACAVRFSWTSRSGLRRITFSGDVGPGSDSSSHLPLLPSRKRFEHGDYTVVESTYGSTVRGPDEMDLELRLDRLELEIKRCFHQRGVLVIPCFAIGRTQDVLFDLHLLRLRGRLPRGLPVFFDAGLASRINEVYATELRARASRPTFQNDALLDALGLVVDDEDARRQIDEALANTLGGEAWQKLSGESRDLLVGPAVVVTGGGMCDGGFVQTHLARHLADPMSTILLTGYAAPTSVAGQLFGRGGEPLAAVQVAGRILGPERIRARIRRITGYSAHADQAGLLDWVFGTQPGLAPKRRLFVTHGEPRASQGLVKAANVRARRLGLSTRADWEIGGGRWFDLDEDTWCAPRAPAAHVERPRA